MTCSERSMAKCLWLGAVVALCTAAYGEVHELTASTRGALRLTETGTFTAQEWGGWSPIGAAAYYQTWLKFDIPASGRRVVSATLHFGPYESQNTVYEPDIYAHNAPDDSWATNTIQETWPVNRSFVYIQGANNTALYQAQRRDIDVSRLFQNTTEGVGRTLSIRLWAARSGAGGFRITNPANYTTLTVETEDMLPTSYELNATLGGSTMTNPVAGFTMLHEAGNRTTLAAGPHTTWLKFDLPPQWVGIVTSATLNFGPYSSYAGGAEPWIVAAYVPDDSWTATTITNTWPIGVLTTNIQAQQAVATYQGLRRQFDLTDWITQPGEGLGQPLSIRITAGGSGNRGFHITNPANYTTLTVGVRIRRGSVVQVQ